MNLLYLLQISLTCKESFVRKFLQGMIITKTRFFSQLLLTEYVLWTYQQVITQLLINDKGYPSFEKILFKKFKFLCTIRTHFETTISQSINHTKFEYCLQETFNTTKGRLPRNRCYKFSFFLRHFCVKKWQLSFFCSKERDMVGWYVLK